MKNTEITFNKKITDPTDCKTINALELFEAIINGKWKDEVLKCRLITDADEYKNFKVNYIPAILFGGAFNHRSQNGLMSPSGLICIDIDGKDQPENFNIEKCKEELSKIPYFIFVAKSVGGNGLFAVCKVQNYSSKLHGKYYDEVSKSLPYVIDKAPKNIASARFVSYDPDAYFNPDATGFELKINPTPPNKKKIYSKEYKAININPTEKKVNRLVNEIEEKDIKIVPTYDEFYKLSFAFADMGEMGRNYFHRVCSVSPNYNFKDAEKKFNQSLRSQNGGITIATFFEYCKNAGLNVLNKKGEYSIPLIKWNHSTPQIEKIKPKIKKAKPKNEYKIGIWLPEKKEEIKKIETPPPPPPEKYDPDYIEWLTEALIYENRKFGLKPDDE